MWSCLLAAINQASPQSSLGAYKNTAIIHEELAMAIRIPRTIARAISLESYGASREAAFSGCRPFWRHDYFPDALIQSRRFLVHSTRTIQSFVPSVFLRLGRVWLCLCFYERLFRILLANSAPSLDCNPVSPRRGIFRRGGSPRPPDGHPAAHGVRSAPMLLDQPTNEFFGVIRLSIIAQNLDWLRIGGFFRQVSNEPRATLIGEVRVNPLQDHREAIAEPD